jgi:hypothetical protein
MTVLPLRKNRFGDFQELRDCAAVARKGWSQRNFVFQDIHHRRHEANDEVGTMNDEVKEEVFTSSFIVPTSYFFSAPPLRSLRLCGEFSTDLKSVPRSTRQVRARRAL